MKKPLITEEQWNLPDSLFAIGSSVVVSLDCWIHAALAIIFLTQQDDILWGSGFVSIILFRTFITWFFLMGDEYEKSLLYQISVFFHLNYIMDGFRCKRDGKFTGPFYWNKLFHATLQSIPLSYAMLYILLEDDDSNHQRLITGSIIISIVCISITTSTCNYAPLYRQKLRHFGSFVLRIMELITFIIVFGVFSHYYKIALLVLIGKYLGSVLLIIYHNYSSDDFRNVLLWALFGGLLDTAIIWFSASQPSKKEADSDATPEFLVEDGTVMTYIRGLIIADLFYIPLLVIIFRKVTSCDCLEEKLAQTALATLIVQHFVLLILGATHPKSHHKNMQVM